jgi:RNA polymerase sigma-70 factor (ECF subfamily)
LDALTSIFLAHLPRPLAREVGIPPELPALLARIEAAGRAAWPELPLPPGRFGAYLGARVAADGAQLGSALGDVHAEDLYLACACVEAVPGAVEAFRRQCRDVVALVVHGIDPAPSFADEVEQTLFQKLLVAGAGAGEPPPRIASYSGRGPLAGWVGVAAQRIALGLLRGEAVQKRARERAVAEQRSIDLDPELLYLKQRYRLEFEAAFQRAVASLPDRERTILRLHLVAGLTLDAIGVIYRVNPSTASRWLASARERLSADTERDLRQRLRLSPAEFDSLARLVVSQLDVSVCRWLEDPKAGSGKL